MYSVFSQWNEKCEYIRLRSYEVVLFRPQQPVYLLTDGGVPE